MNAYHEGGSNYYILKSFNNLNFDIDVNNYEKRWNINKFNFDNNDTKNFICQKREKSLLEPVLLTK